MDKKTKALYIALMVSYLTYLTTGCTAKNRLVEKYNAVKLTNDTKAEWLAAFLGDSVAYTSRKMGSGSQEIYIGDKAPIKIDLGDEIIDNFFGGRNNLRQLDNGKILVPVYSLMPNETRHKLCISLVDPADGSHKLIFIPEQFEAYVFLEGSFRDKFYVTTESYKSGNHIYEVSLNGDKKEISAFPSIIARKQYTIQELKKELWNGLGINEDQLEAIAQNKCLLEVNDFRTDNEGNIIELLVGYYGKNGWIGHEQWDIYRAPYKGNLKFLPNTSNKSGSLLENKMDHLFDKQYELGSRQKLRCDALSSAKNELTKN
ncbi:hypothetical protein HYU07_02980 [Candidatus Woesearchaeota archaeon]|nr:hypothetical protein [Candidatus Woesearchaeota archaeon]